MFKATKQQQEKLSPEEIADTVISLTDKVFGKNGWMVELRGLEFRPGQHAMAMAVAHAITHDTPLIEEAPTGVGKSLAYLIPSIIYAKLSHRKGIVSSHTINLQEQLQKDIRMIRAFFREVDELRPYSDFKDATMFGRGNYLCGTRLKELNNSSPDLSDEVRSDLVRIMHWYQTTTTGVRHEMDPPPSFKAWALVNSDSSGCSPKGACNPNTCFYCKAKELARRADIITLNHSLVFSTIQSLPAQPKRGIMIANDFLILDEAHTVPEIATDHFGTNLHFPSMKGQIKRLCGSGNAKAVLPRNPPLKYLIPFAEKAGEALERIEDELHGLFKSPEQREIKFEPMVSLNAEALATLGKLGEELQGVDETYVLRPLHVMLKDVGKRFSSVAEDLESFTQVPLSQDHAFWAERSFEGDLRLRSAMLDVGPVLKDKIFSQGTSVVCASATLAVGNSLQAFCKRIGADKVNTAQVQSPFNYAENMRFYILSDCPEPRGPTEAKGRDFISEFVRKSVPKVEGGTLVLFTSYQLMHQVAESIEPFCKRRGYPFGMQGGNKSRTELVHMMKTSPHTVLFGTSSFWTGIDIPGNSLKHLIVTRLPFEVPTHPVAVARQKALQKLGKNPFMELSLNECVWRFRQGIGRLIRTASDQGILTLMDDRVLHKRYGQTFLNSVPQTKHIPLTRAQWGEFCDPYARGQLTLLDLAS